MLKPKIAETNPSKPKHKSYQLKLVRLLVTPHSLHFISHFSFLSVSSFLPYKLSLAQELKEEAHIPLLSFDGI